MSMLITKQKFTYYQNAFYKKLLRTPYKVGLEIVSVRDSTDSEEDFLASFVGDSTRESVTYTFNTLYEKEISDRTREKYGLPKEVNGIVYLSPKQLIPKLGTYKLDWNKTKVHFEGRTQVINKIVYLESLYDSCVGIQIFVQDELKGG